MQQVVPEPFYIPSDVLDEVQGVVEYQQEVNNMLATILETRQEMESTMKESVAKQSIADTNPADHTIFMQYQQKYPKLVDKVVAKFQKFNLTMDQLLRFIEIEEKFVRLKRLQRQNRKKNRMDTERGISTKKEEKKNLVKVYPRKRGQRLHKMNARFLK